MTRPPAVVLLAFAVCACSLLAGCGEMTAGSPQRTEGTQRPWEIRLDGVDPCSLVPESDFAKYHFEGSGKVIESRTFRSPECSYGTQVGDFAVTLVVTEGIEAWTTGERNIDVADVEPVGGFPAIALVSRVDLNRCAVAVDVADGQYLMGEVGLLPGTDSRVPEKCDYAYELAESAMKGLVAS